MNNYHTHTQLCHHAEGLPIDYARIAQEQGAKILGISDHAPLPDGRWEHVRMTMEELPYYESEIQRAREAVQKLKILKGAECEWDDAFAHYYREELLGEHQFDYLIGAIHWYPHRGSWMGAWETSTPDQLVSYARHLVKTMESGVFSFIAHPDVFGSGYAAWDENCDACAREVLEAAAELKMPMEINGYGFRKSGQPYPRPEFWEIASEYPIQALCNSDAHQPEDVLASLDRCTALGEKYGIAIIDPFDH